MKHLSLLVTAITLIAGGVAGAQTLPGAGGTLPDAFIGTYESPRADSSDHLITVTPFGLASTSCRALDCEDGALNFSTVLCPSPDRCVFAAAQCIGSVTRLSNGTVLLTSTPAEDDRDSVGLCRGLAGTAFPLDVAAVAALPDPVPDIVVEENDCEIVQALFTGDREYVPVGDSYFLGPEDAPVTIVEFTDFECPYCGRVQTALHELLAAYPDQVRIVVKHNPLSFHSHANQAAQAALAAGEQGQFFELHDLLFSNQRALARNDLERYATEIGLDLVPFRAFLDASSGGGVISDDQALASDVGATGTPYFFVNGRILRGAQPYAAFETLVLEEIASAAQARDRGVSSRAIYECLIGGE